jgi:hypothetical protein
MQERGTRGTAMTKWPPTDLQRGNTQVDRGLALGAANSMGRSVISNSATKSLGATFHVRVLAVCRRETRIGVRVQGVRVLRSRKHLDAGR